MENIQEIIENSSYKKNTHTKNRQQQKYFYLYTYNKKEARNKKRILLTQFMANTQFSNK